VPGAIDEFTQRIQEMGSMYAAVELANLKGPRRQRRRGRDAYRALTDGRMRMAPTRDYVLSLTLMAMEITTDVIRELPWTLFHTESRAFVCSDRPITMHDPTPPDPWSGAAWLSSPNVITTVPLSSTCCLRICHGDRSHWTTRRVQLQVEAINLRTYGWASRFVYGSSADLLQRLHVYASAHPELIPAASKKRSVLLEDLSTADPAVAAANVARGWDPYFMQPQEDGSVRPMSYEVIDSVDDAMKALAPREPASPRS
jgi:hypothetical protein